MNHAKIKLYRTFISRLNNDSYKDTVSNGRRVVPLRKECGVSVKKNKVSTIVKDPDP